MVSVQGQNTAFQPKVATPPPIGPTPHSTLPTAVPGEPRMRAQCMGHPHLEQSRRVAGRFIGHVAVYVALTAGFIWV